MIKAKTVSVAEPFLKWAGGKRQMIEQYQPYIPEEFTNYHEPFLGGGGMFFHLLASGALKDKGVYLSDINHELIQTCWAIRDCVEEVISELQVHKANHKKLYYYQIRSLDQGEPLSLVQAASRMIYLNKTCFNGLYRVNRKGYFNTPIGDYKNPNIANAANLTLVSAAFRDTRTAIIHDSYETVVDRAVAGDLVYFDPPYFFNPPNREKPGAFAQYTASGFSFEDHQNLQDVAQKLTDKGVKVMISNSDFEFVRELYSSYRIVEVSEKRNVNSAGNKRGDVSGLLILNY